MIGNIETFNQIAAGRNVRFDKIMVRDAAELRFASSFRPTAAGWAFFDDAGRKVVSITMIAGEVDAVIH